MLRGIDNIFFRKLNLLDGKITRYKTVLYKKSNRRLKRDKKIGMNSTTWDSKPPLINDKVFLAATDAEDVVVSEFLLRKAHQQADIQFKSMHLLCSIEEWKEFIAQTYKNRLRIFQSGEENGSIFFEKAIVKYSISSTYISVKLIGEFDFIQDYEKNLIDNFDIAQSFIEWMYSSDGSSVTVPLTTDKTPISAMYPFLGDEKLTDYYDRYMHSSASVLVLIGPPGTGKTTFIRGLLQHTKTSAIVTYDHNLLEKDYVFASFIESSNNIMVLEDADSFLGSRNEGNTVMHKFLNVGDGLITTKNKKLIFSTNLPSVKDIDPALIRPGRCFDVLTFDYLTKQQAKNLAKIINVELYTDSDTYSIADIFHKQTYKVKSRPRIGFS
jgi:hypothetical protein